MWVLLNALKYLNWYLFISIHPATTNDFLNGWSFRVKAPFKIATDRVESRHLSETARLSHSIIFIPKMPPFVTPDDEGGGYISGV